MKKALLFLLLLLGGTISALTVDLQLLPASPAADEVFQLVLATNSSETPRYTLPQVKNLQISGKISSRRSSISIINGVQEQSFSYGMNALASAPGRYTIPSFEVTAGNKTVRTKPLTFMVRDASQPAEPDGKNSGRVQMQIHITPDRQLYTGETARLTLEIMVPENLRLTSILGVNDSGFGDALFIRQGRNKAKFVQGATRQRVYKDVRYIIYELSAYFQPQSSGEFTPRCEAVLQMSVPGRDDFFGGGFFSFGTTREIAVRASGKTLSVRPLPPVPDGAENTGLVGNWLFEMNVPLQAEFKSGEVAEITLNVSGDAPAELFHAPEITIPQARLYPPEVKRTATGFTVKYLFVPLTPGAREVKQILAFFNPEKSRYEVVPCEVKFLVVPGSTATAASPAKPAAAPAKPAEAETEPAAQVREFPLYPLEPGSGVILPLWENQRAWIIFFLLGGAIMMVISLIRRFRKKDPALKARKSIRRELARMASEISASGNAVAVVQKHGVAEIASALDLPSGATAEQIAEKMDDPEIREFFISLNRAAFLPGGKYTETPDVRKKVTAFLKKLTLILILLAVMPLQADFYRGRTAFDGGKYSEAKEFFHQMINPDAPDPYSVFNFGCPSYMLGEYPAATLAFEQALLLAPADTRIRSAFHDTLSKLPGERKNNDGSFGGFITSLRDRVRPDYYLLAGAFAFFLLGILSLCGRFPGKRIAATLGVLVIVLAVAAVWSQSLTTYSPSRARIVTARAELHRLPAASGSVSGIIPGGSEVKITGHNGDWVQIRLANGNGGWVKRSDVMEIIPHGIW